MSNQVNAPQNVLDKLKSLGVDKSDYWSLPQNKRVVILTHKALERVAAASNVRLDPPTIIESDGANNHATVLVVGHLGDKTEWSFGEASPLNYKTHEKAAKYPWAMAEKRAKDRVILKLVGLHGDVYSSVDDFEADGQQENQAPAPKEAEAPVVELAKVKEAKALLGKLNWNIDEFETKVAKQRINEMNEERLDNMIAYLQQELQEVAS